jgi:hypothetical protein
MKMAEQGQGLGREQRQGQQNCFDFSAGRTSDSFSHSSKGSSKGSQDSSVSSSEEEEEEHDFDVCSVTYDERRKDETNDIADSDEGIDSDSDDSEDSDEDADHQYDLKDDDYRPSAGTTTAEYEHAKDSKNSFDYVPRRSSILHNQETAKLKQKQHKLHSIMRQESLQERQARASLKLEKRKRLSQLKKQQKEAEREAADMNTENREKRLERGASLARTISIDDSTFEAKKNVMKQYKAHDSMRRNSVEVRQNKQREALARRLEKRRLEAT